MARRPRSARPPFCPHRDCDSHATAGPWRCIKKGFFARSTPPRRVQRYRCSRCHRSFSAQTFSPTYWLKRPDLLPALFFRTLACSAHRQIARELGVAHTTIQHQIERLGRHCLLLHESLRPDHAPREPLVLDGFRTFEAGQDWPFDLHLLLGADSHYVYGFNEAELRRSGTMTPRQRRRRQALEAAHGRPHPQATREAVAELVARVVPAGASAVIHSDQHRAYPPALRSLAGRTLTHHTTSSRRARTPRNPLFPVNLADLLLRHSSANHKRETIAFSKRRQGALYRVAIWAVWRNYVKSLSERRRDAPPGVRIGVIPRRMEVDDLLRTRLFPWRVGLTGWLARCYEGRIRTRCLPRCRVHTPRFAV